MARGRRGPITGISRNTSEPSAQLTFTRQSRPAPLSTVNQGFEPYLSSDLTDSISPPLEGNDELSPALENDPDHSYQPQPASIVQGNILERPSEVALPQLYLPHVPARISIMLDHAVAQPAGTVLFTRFDDAFTPATITRLTPGKYLNDVIINSYLKMIQARNAERPDAPRIFTHNTFFTNVPEERRARIPPQGNPITDADIIFFPLHLADSLHWVLAVMDIPMKTLMLYDSLSRDETIAQERLAPLRRWVDEISISRMSAVFDWRGWNIGMALGAPQQTNSYDCGVFLLVNAERLSRRLPLIHGQMHMPYYRLRIAFELIENRLLE